MQLRPDRLRAHAAAVADLIETLDRLGRPAGADALDTAVTRSRRDLADLHDALLAAALGAEVADDQAAAAVDRAAR